MSGDGQGPIRGDRPARAGDRSRGRSIGEILDETRWDRRPSDDVLSPLASVDRYFREFPWDGTDDAPDGKTGGHAEQAAAPAEPFEPWPGEADSRHNR